MSEHAPNCPCTFCWGSRQIRALEAENAQLREELKLTRDLLQAAISDGAKR